MTRWHLSTANNLCRTGSNWFTLFTKARRGGYSMCSMLVRPIVCLRSDCLSQERMLGGECRSYQAFATWAGEIELGWQRGEKEAIYHSSPYNLQPLETFSAYPKRSMIVNNDPHTHQQIHCIPDLCQLVWDETISCIHPNSSQKKCIIEIVAPRLLHLKQMDFWRCYKTHLQRRFILLLSGERYHMMYFWLHFFTWLYRWPSNEIKIVFFCRWAGIPLLSTSVYGIRWHLSSLTFSSQSPRWYW